MLSVARRGRFLIVGLSEGGERDSNRLRLKSTVAILPRSLFVFAPIRGLKDLMRFDAPRTEKVPQNYLFSQKSKDRS